MIIWGGANPQEILGGGAAYDPSQDAWDVINAQGGPTPRFNHRAIWTGSEMLIWGGDRRDLPYDELNAGGLYDPVLDRWRLVSSAESGPESRIDFSMVWTGDRAIVWGGAQESPSTGGLGGRQDGGAYDPMTDTWLPTPLSGAPTRRLRHTAVWIGSEMIVWGGARDVASGQNVDYRTDAAAHDPLGPTPNLDGDDFCDPLDCDDSNAAVWASPGEVNGLRFATTAQLFWEPVEEPGATAVTYGVLRAVSPSDFTNLTYCLPDGDRTDLMNEDPYAPPQPGQAYYYLVRARNGCPGLARYGTLGIDSFGQPRETDSTCP